MRALDANKPTLEPQAAESMSVREAWECGIMDDLARGYDGRDPRGGRWVRSGDRYYRILDDEGR